MTTKLANATDSDITHVVTGEATTLADVHVMLNRHLETPDAASAGSILVDLRATQVDASSMEVPLFIEFLKTRLLPFLRERSSALVVLAENQSAATPLGSILAAITNLHEFTDDVVVADSFESAYRALA
jgi:hypothetical protein